VPLVIDEEIPTGANPVAVPLFAIVAPEGIESVSPDCPSVIVPVPERFNIVSTLNVLMLI
jgi:hypothetical protein